MPGLRKDQSRCYVRRNSGHRRKAAMDDQAWRKGPPARATTHQLPDDVQTQRSTLGTVRSSRCLRELEVRVAPYPPSSPDPKLRRQHSYPFHNALSPIISTLFTGSALLLKPSESTAFSSTYFTSIARSALAACSHSPHLIQSVPCWPSTANHLTSHPGVSHITFIGSRPIAHTVCTSAARSLTPVCVELGGKDPAVLLDSLSPTDLEKH
ncbi:MAG: hypothetical protein Q9173_006839, partial [Seirophora scorigena]